ncbi:PAS domain S-box protein [Rossellomorea aquimaris]|uniref:PAS domain S-box protein n=1 Tax=Rossellomorea aquimaris TaxID=189382 RepID=UPI001CD38F46|nr:PAS domain S-box protein [Rossellomorea aquimaris]MCA1055942.1 PAS domain S-box protein [Rossellomorea aquimaris]
MAEIRPMNAISIHSIPVPAALWDVENSRVSEANTDWEEMSVKDCFNIKRLLDTDGDQFVFENRGYSLRRNIVEDGMELLMLLPGEVGQIEKETDRKESSFSEIYQSLIRNTPTCVCVINKNGVLTEMNDSFKKLFELTDDSIGESLCQQSTFKNPEFVNLVIKGIKGENAKNEEVTFTTGSGMCTCNITISPVDYSQRGTVDHVGIILHDISEKKDYENSLISLKVELENTLRLQKTITYTIKKENNDFVIEMAAGELLNKLEISPSKVIGKTIQEVFDSYHLGKIQPKLQQIWETGQELTYEDEYKGLEYISSIVPVMKQGKVTKIICSIADISMIKDIQRKLEETQQKYRSIVEYSPDNIYMLDTEGIIQEVNPAAEGQWTVRSPELIGRHYSEFISEDKKGETSKHFNTALQGEATRYLSTLINKEGKKSHISVTNIPIRVKDKVIGIYGIGQDITERIKMEDELKEAKELLEAYFEHAGDGIALLDPVGNILKVNQHFELMFGWKEIEIAGKAITILHKEEQVSQFKQNLKDVKEGKRIKDFETVRYRKDGSPIEIVFNLNPILNDSGELIGISAIIRDLSEKKRNEDLLEKSEQLAMIGQLAAGVAHEIRNPLTTIKGFLQLMKESTEDDFYLKVIQGELDRIEIITNEFLALAKPRAVQFSLTSLTSLLTSSVEFIKMECLKQGVDVRFSVEEAEIHCDSHQIKQVVLNVMKNALEAMPDGGLMNVQLQKEQDYAKISIQDNGAGIPPERLKHLGEPFYSTKERGTGLGLMICQKIIKEHNGSISIQSNVNEGTTVAILLPIAGNEE